MLALHLLKSSQVLQPRVGGFPRLVRLLLRDCSTFSLEAFGSCPLLSTFDHNQLSNFRCVWFGRLHSIAAVPAATFNGHARLLA